jgi:hypothetical protein
VISSWYFLINSGVMLGRVDISLISLLID